MKKDIQVQLWEWWLNELSAITRRVLAEEEKRQTRKRTKAEKLLGEYQTYRDAQDAYGCGVITERQFNRITDLLEQAKPEPSALYYEKLSLLQELYQEQKQILEDRERWEALHAEGT